MSTASPRPSSISAPHPPPLPTLPPPLSLPSTMSTMTITSSGPLPSSKTPMTTSPRNPRPSVLTSGPSPPSTNSPAQLAAILAETLQENENLKRELAIARRNAEKYERMVGLTQNSPQSSTSPPSPEALSQSAVKRLIDCENKLERMQIERDEAQARIKILQELWNQLNHYLDHCEFRIRDAREGFNRRMADAGGKLVEITPEQLALHLPELPFPNAGHFPPPAYLPHESMPPNNRSRTHHHHRQPPPLANIAHSKPPSLHQTPTALVPPSGSISSPVASFSVPPQPSSRVRPRADSLDGPSHSSGGLPPAKKLRGGDSVFVENAKYGGSPNTVHAHPPPPPPPPPQPRPPPTNASHGPTPHRETRRNRNRSDASSGQGQSPHRPSSRSSSTSLDEMLIEATSVPHDGQPPPPGQYGYPIPPPHPQTHHAHTVHPPRSPSPTQTSASRVGMYPSPGQGAGMHSYQTHIFAPPVTGAPPVRKSNTSASMASSLSRGGSLAGNLSHHQTHVLGPGGYPPTNAQGQRICRQCGLVGRYKDGKCVEKWGPGPEGPGTVCDKCRKKMKRVERRGTIESQQQREQREQYQQVQQALAIHRSQQQSANATNPPPPPTHSDNGFHDRTHSSSITGSSLRRTDTVVIGPGMNYEHPSRTPPPPPRPDDIRPHAARPSDPEITHHNGANGNGIPRTPQEPATVRARSDLDHLVENVSPSRVSDRGKASASSPSPAGSHPHISTPNGSNKADEIHPADTSLEEVDNDAEGEEDAEAELLEAVDAAEEAAHALREKSSGGSHADDPDDVDMKIEQEI